MSGRLIKRGAEAEIRSVTWKERPAVTKRRLAKGYRLAEIDGPLRASRTRSEARLLSAARSAGISTPVVYDVDLGDTTITMAMIEGLTLKEELEKNGGSDELLTDLGGSVAKMHRADIVHGDLTGMNIILSDGNLHFLDFGLGERSTEIEAKGVDLHVLQEAFKAINLEDRFPVVIEGYLKNWPGGKEVVERMDEIAMRGRYI